MSIRTGIGSSIRAGDGDVHDVSLFGDNRYAAEDGEEDDGEDDGEDATWTVHIEITCHIENGETHLVDHICHDPEGDCMTKVVAKELAATYITQLQRAIGNNSGVSLSMPDDVTYTIPHNLLSMSVATVTVEESM
jgi:hypothetical protein